MAYHILKFEYNLKKSSPKLSYTYYKKVIFSCSWKFTYRLYKYDEKHGMWVSKNWWTLHQSKLFREVFSSCFFFTKIDHTNAILFCLWWLSNQNVEIFLGIWDWTVFEIIRSHFILCLLSWECCLVPNACSVQKTRMGDLFHFH